MQITLVYGFGFGYFWVDGLYFGGRSFSGMQNDVASKNSIGLREIVEVNEALGSDLECESHAKALLASLKTQLKLSLSRAPSLITADRPYWQATKSMLICPTKA